ncbi:MAG: enoyl-ACP reductase [Deltaproteobacteria bacterium]|nr:enoyl-ACP reductase [Deltaproteobacteria bacterium]
MFRKHNHDNQGEKYEMISFSGKKGLVLGIANQRSIATAVAEVLNELGAEMAFTYGPDPKGRFAQNVEKVAEEMNVSHVLPLDVANDQDIADVFGKLEKEWGGLDFVVHSVAFAERENLETAFSLTSREGWNIAQDISAYSIVPVTRYAIPLMRNNGGGSVVGMSFIGSVLAVPNYNVMGPAKAALESAVRYLARELGPENIRANTISAGAIRTLSSSGIGKFGEMLKVAGEHSATGRNVTTREVAMTAAFLLSDCASAITGQTIYVDGGYNIMAN